MIRCHFKVFLEEYKMFSKEELAIGAKRAVLEYIAIRGIPTATIYTKEEALRLDSGVNLVVRADSACQWGGFSGVFGSFGTRENLLKISGPRPGEAYTPSEFGLEQLIAIASLNEDFSSGDKHRDALVKYNIQRIQKKIEWYCSGLNLDIPDKPETLIQDTHSKSDALFQHPNNSDLVVISRNKRTVLYNRATDSFIYFIKPPEHENGFEIPSDEKSYLREAIKTYDTIVTFEKFADMGMTFEMEFGKNRNSESPIVYQFKPFRKIEYADFCLLPESGEDVINFDLPISITPADGIILRYDGGAIIDYLSPETAKDYSSIVTIIAPSGDQESEYPHIVCPGIMGLLYPVFNYTRDHGARESLMKVPFVFCNVSEFNGTTPLQSDETRISDYGLLQKIEDSLKDGQSLRLYSDGIRGRIDIL